jgi:MFS family permease
MTSSVDNSPGLTRRPPVLADPSTWRGRALAPVLVYVGLLVAVISSLGAPLVPTIADDYDVALGTAQWSLTITLLVGALTTPVVGRLADGPRRLHVLIAALAVMAGGSALAALPTGIFALLLTGRAMQGVGLALLPLVMGVARDHFEPGRARSVLATLSVTAVVGIGLGYPLTGVIAEHLDFHMAFWLAAVLGLIALILAALVVPTSMHRRSEKFDVVGAVLLGLGLAGLLVGMSEGESWGWGSARLLVLAATSLLVLAGWVWHQLHQSRPLIDLRLMRHRTVLTANVAGIIAGVGMYMLMSMIIRYVETPTSTGYGLGTSVLVGSLVLLPMSIASYFSSKLATRLGRWLTPGKILPLGLLGFIVSLALFAISRGELWEIFVIMGVAGVGMGCSFAVMPRMIVSATAPEETGSALAMNQVLRTVGYSIGSALSATILTAHTTSPSRFPVDRGYTVGAIVGISLCVLAAVVAVALQVGDVAPAPVAEPDEQLAVDESVESSIAGVPAFEPDEPRAS